MTATCLGMVAPLELEVAEEGAFEDFSDEEVQRQNA
jgi:hypothetical protein